MGESCYYFNLQAIVHVIDNVLIFLSNRLGENHSLEAGDDDRWRIGDVGSW